MVPASDAVYGFAALFCLLLIAGAEIGYINGRYAALVLVAGALTALVISAVHFGKVGTMATDNEETIEVEGMGFKGKASGRRLLSENTLWLVLLIAIAALAWKHHSESESQMARLEALVLRQNELMVEWSYIISRSQAERERLDLQMPESLRRKLRAYREP